MGAKLEILAAVLCSVTMVLLIYQQGVESVQGAVVKFKP